MAEMARSLLDYAAPPVARANAPVNRAQPKSLLDYISEIDLLRMLEGTGIPERAAAANDLLNPLAAIPRAQDASQELFAPNRTGMERLSSTGNMLTELAGIAAPIAAAARAGVPAATALMEGLLGGSPTTQAVGDTARGFLADESGALRLMGDVKLTRENAPLVAHHNLSPTGVSVAADIGGIPMPSLAISRADYPLTNFGDVTLLAPPSAVTPGRKITVWPTDVYTGRQPRGELQFSDKKAVNSALKVDPDFGHMRDITYWMDATDSFQDADEMMKTAQLGVREGIDPKKFESMFDYVSDVRSKLGMELYDKRDAMQGLEAFGGVERVLYPKELFTASGSRRKPAPYTLNAVMDRMTKNRAYQAGSEGWNYGPGSFRAVSTPPFKSMTEISDARGNILPSSGMSPFKKTFEDAYSEALSAIESSNPSAGWREAPDAMLEIAMGRNPTWFGEIPPEVRSQVSDLARASRNLPTEYFEAKPRAAMQLSDFSAALVPEGQDATVDILRSQGVQNILTYGSPEERVALFRRFPDLLFSVGATAGIPLGLLSMPSNEEQY
jgi:hypothetical protein